jgi:hypothetical protein
MRTVIIDGKEYTWHEAHQDLWNELSQNPGMSKDDWFEKHEVQISKNRSRVRNNCFACEYCKWNCKECPIVLWRNDVKIRLNCCTCACAWAIEDSDPKNGLFYLWCDAFSDEKYGEACKIAKQIADLEWIEPDEPK